MEFSIKSIRLEKARGTVVAGIFEPGELTVSARVLDEASNGLLSERIRRGDLTGKSGETLKLFDVPGLSCTRLLLVGLGRQTEFRSEAYAAAFATVVRALKESTAEEILLTLPETAPDACDWSARIRHAVIALRDAAYVFADYRRKSAEPEKSPPPKKLAFLVARSEQAAAKAALAEGEAIADGIALARDLGNQPGNVCTPAFLARAAEKLAKTEGVSCKVLEQKDMEKLGMGALLAVAQGSRQPPKFIILRWKGAPSDEAPIVLVGKGITFDSGGISLKPATGMEEMKYDMCGAAAVLGALRTAARLKLPLNLVVLVPACENMPGGRAVRPGDIVTSLSGQTIEILNTDAEGRLILCDALTYAERFKPAAILDVATLTGACVVALGTVASGLFASEEALAGELETASKTSGDKVWRLPLWPEYQESLKSAFADMANVASAAGRPAGAVTAACFLSRFTGETPWAHLDIAGTAWNSRAPKGATGRPVSLLAHFLLARAAQKRTGA